MTRALVENSTRRNGSRKTNSMEKVKRKKFKSLFLTNLSLLYLHDVNVVWVLRGFIFVVFFSLLTNSFTL